MKRIYVFIGPTLRAEEAAAELDAVYLPPVKQGDVYRAAQEKPWAIALIDGYFDRVPSVTHKEILWAMSQGIHVFGASSMGALRAAELAMFGMEGVGRVFEAFHRGELEDDDEVAVMHGSPEDGYRVLSEAMVNIRSTLEAAEAEGALTATSRGLLERLAKGLPYPDRCYPLLLTQAKKEGVPPEELAALRDWLPSGRRNAKREDALALLRLLRERAAVSPGPKQVFFHFENTDTWVAMRDRASRTPLGVGTSTGAGLEEALREELGVAGKLEAARWEALARALALSEMQRSGRTVPPEAVKGAADAFRVERCLFSPEDFERWRQAHGLEDVTRFFQDEARVRWVRTMAEGEVGRALPDQLRVRGEYGPMLARAREKERVLAGHGAERLTLEEAGLTEAQLWRWYFEERLRRPVPAYPAAYAQATGFPEPQAFLRAVLREYWFVRLSAVSD